MLPPLKEIRNIGSISQSKKNCQDLYIYKNRFLQNFRFTPLERPGLSNGVNPFLGIREENCLCYNTPMFFKKLEILRENRLLREIRDRTSPQGPKVKFGERELINF